MRAMLIAAAFALPLAACSKEPSVSATNATPAEVAEQVAAAGGADAVTVQPGRWEGTVTIRELEFPGMPAEAKTQMMRQMGGAKTFANCVTEEDVKQQKAFFTGEGNDRSCKYDRFNLSGGKIDAAMSCTPATGKMSMTMAGTYSADSYHIDMASKADAELVAARDQLRQGDLVFFGLKGRINHVGIYVGEGRFLHSPSSGKDVRVDSLITGYWANRYLSGRRVAM